MTAASLRKHVFAGGSLDVDNGASLLAETAIIECALLAPAARHVEARRRLELAERLQAEGDPGGARVMRWQAEILDDAGSRALALSALPVGLVDELEAELAGQRGPNPIVVSTPGVPWRCLSCGTPFDAGAAGAFTVTARPDYGDLEYPITYCGPCITAAAEALRCS